MGLGGTALKEESSRRFNVGNEKLHDRRIAGADKALG